MGDDEKIEIRDMMGMSLSFDHRIIDGAMGSRFGYMLQQSGNDVLFVDKWDEHIHEINHSGLTVINEEGKK